MAAARDWDADRHLVRYCVGDLRPEMLWCTSDLADFWVLTLKERRRLLEVIPELLSRLAEGTTDRCTV